MRTDSLFGPGVKGSFVCRGKAGRVADGGVPGRGVGAPGVYSTVRRGGIHGAVVQVAAHVRLGLCEGISGIMNSFSQIFLHSRVTRGGRGATRTDSSLDDDDEDSEAP